MHITSVLPPPLAYGARPSAAPRQTEPQLSANAAVARPGQTGAAERHITERQLRQEQQEIEQLLSRDREVRTHEQAHASVGGQHAGAPSYSFTRGPDGKRYATEGEVPIDTGAITGDPAGTLLKMDVVIRAALAPAEPSAQDRKIAAKAQTTAAQARLELALELRQAAAAGAESKRQTAAESGDEPRLASASAGARVYQQIETPTQAARIDQVV